MNTHAIPRRRFLKAAGISIALPWFESAQLTRAEEKSPRPTRLVLAWYGLGFHTPNLFPKQAGRGYEPSRYLAHFAGVRDQMTVISKLHQEGRRGGHGIKAYAWRGIPEGNYLESFDVFAGRKIGGQHRFPNLCLGEGGQSFASNGVAISPLRKPSAIFAALFVEPTPAARAEAATRIRQGHSILDRLVDQAKSQRTRLNAADREKLDQYLDAVRQSELDLKRQAEWAAVPKPAVNAKAPKDINDKAQFVDQAKQYFDMIYLALSSNSTRIVSSIMPNYNVVPDGIPGVDGDHHVLTHHGQIADKIRQLSLIEDAEMKAVAAFLKQLKDTPDGDGTLLDHTMVCIGSESNDLSRHAGEEVPLVLAGGPFKHGQHLQREALVQNLYLTMLHKLGIENEKWGNSTGVLSELG